MYCHFHSIVVRRNAEDWEQAWFMLMQCLLRAKREHLDRFQGFLPESQGQNLSDMCHIDAIAVRRNAEDWEQA